MRPTSLAGAVALALALGACDRGPAPTDPEALANATYLSEATPDGVVALIGGAYDFPAGGEIERVELVDTAVGDLDYDDEPDAAALLAEVRGQDVYLKVHALLSDGSETQDVASRLLGNRVVVQALRVSESIIEVDLLIRGQGVPISQPPTTPITTRFALTEAGLRPVNPPVNRMSGSEGAETQPMAEIPTLTSNEWILTTIQMGDWSMTTDALAERPSLRFAVELGDESAGSGSMSGFAGCNRMFGSYTNDADGGMTIGGIGLTRRMCDQELTGIEQRVAASLGAATGFELEDNELTITFDGGVMRFSAGVAIMPVEIERADERPEQPSAPGASGRQT